MGKKDVVPGIARLSRTESGVARRIRKKSPLAKRVRQGAKRIVRKIRRI